MAVNESMVQDIVKEVMAKMQLASAPTGNHGVFQDMNEAIEAAKKSQKIVRRMSMDQRADHFCYPQKDKRKCRDSGPHGCGRNRNG